MIRKWLGHYNLADMYEMEQDVLETAMKSVFYRESRFDHRAVSEADDRGISQVSRLMRKRIRELHHQGFVDFSFDEEQYFNPNNAIRAGIWVFGQDLASSDGDLKKAISIYHRGPKNFYDAAGIQQGHSVLCSLGKPST